MTPFSFIGFSLFFTCLFLGILILKYGTNRLHLTFGLQNLSIAIWGLGLGFVGLSKTPTCALFWWKIAHIGAFFVIALLLHHALLLNNISQKGVLIIAYSLAISLPVLFFLNLLGIKMRIAFNSIYYMEPETIIYPIYCIAWVAIGVYITFLIIKAYLKAVPKDRISYRFYSVAYLVGMWGGTSHFFPVFGIDIYPYAQLLVLVYCGIMTYAIFRHRLLNIEVIIKKTLVFAGLSASVFAALILPTLLIQDYILRSAGFGGRLIGLAISGLVIILTMRRIENFLINVTDRYLFQKKYDYKELLKTFTAEVLTVLNLDNLVNLTVDKLDDIIKLKSCAVLLFDDEKQQFDVMASHNIKDPSVTLIRPDGIVTFMEETHGYLLISELHMKKLAIPSSIEDIIDKLNAELIIPMVMHDEVVGVLSLGKKKSDEGYTRDDLDMLLPLARTLAIAISNAQLFVELGKTQAEAAQNEKMAVIGTLSAGINHEICNPLGIARGQCEAFLLNIKDGLYDNKSNDELLTMAKGIMVKVIKETDRATAITKKLSGFAKPAKGEAEVVDIAKEVKEVFGLVGYELKLEKIEFEKHIEKDLSNVFVDKKQFQEVLFNLIRNAGQAIGEKGKITIRAKGDRGRVFIEIQDSGSGIPQDKIKELFNPFFTTKDPGKGTGLGLFIVRQVIEKNGGRIYLKETKVGAGTTFALEFPSAEVAQELARRAKIKEEAETQKAKD
ncbi:MAG: ATP-binding protein [Candidatus Omnitrophota bacterium]|nr:ATP-binding protein [Candidatus Omnitrophota bacterium]